MSAWLSRLWATDECFVALLPANRTAAVAFSDVYARVTATNKNMMVSKGEMTLAEALAFYASLASDITSGRPSTPQAVDGSSFSSTDTVDDADLAPTTIGAFVFSFETMPLRRKLGWFAGLPLSAKFRYNAEKAEADMALTLHPSHGLPNDTDEYDSVGFPDGEIDRGTEWTSGREEQDSRNRDAGDISQAIAREVGSEDLRRPEESDREANAAVNARSDD
ncbi:hypothetical protein B0A55_07963 [Friedmanniomyces simplex]|uniref:Uncharacterized protein n=1 Tax=Friedmanniomyces simplex TaxID=329884 RepID=A0A4V5NGL1_9PEZI|nr:hypothetical protein B0A55_07963 [Friedmanniomyces simplex]